uniref:Uncharacterized protein n=1 Tax=viral metagenome TaxID=1070528 RepID=A0A6C0JI51_9ZZZZ
MSRCKRCPQQYNIQRYQSNAMDNLHKNVRRIQDIFNSVFTQYTNRIETMEKQKLLLNNQASILNIAKDQLKDQDSKISDNNDSIHTIKRKIMYNEPADKLSQITLDVLKFILLVIGITLIIMIAKK